MGKKSTKENKTIYQQCREALDLTREQAAEKTDYLLSADKIEKIENERVYPHPEDVLEMSKCYNAPDLCNYYCSHECPIGQVYVPEVKIKDLSQITLEMLYSLDQLDKERQKLVEITVDGQITADEMEDFKRIDERLSQISMTIDSLKLWVQKSIAEGKIEE